MHALIDADTPVFSAAVVSEGEEEWVATSRLDSSIQKIIDAMPAHDSYTLFVSGKGNFRYEIEPLYKSNRPPSPEHREACRLHLIERWGAVECCGYEADDAVGCEQNDNTFIVGIDKDLLMIPGKHYSWPIERKGVVVREALNRDVTIEQGMRTFFEQVLIGDRIDNIIGVNKIGPVKARKALANCNTERQMYAVCRNMYNDDERFHKNLDLLWIWREYGMTYTARRECQ
jgi:5'-3' exonuclease